MAKQILVNGVTNRPLRINIDGLDGLPLTGLAGGVPASGSVTTDLEGSGAIPVYTLQANGASEGSVTLTLTNPIAESHDSDPIPFNSDAATAEAAIGTACGAFGVTWGCRVLGGPLNSATPLTIYIGDPSNTIVTVKEHSLNVGPTLTQSQAGSDGAIDIQTINLPNATGGTFTLTYSGQTTAALAYDASSATVQAALEALSNVTAINATGFYGTLPGGLTIQFYSPDGNAAQLTIDDSGLTPTADATAGLVIATIADNEAAATVYAGDSDGIEDVLVLGTFAEPSSGCCRFKEVDATNLPGLYELQLPSARLAVSGAHSLRICILGAADMAQYDGEIQLVAVNLDDAVRAGLASLPNAAAEASGGLITRGTGTGQLSVSGGRAQADVAYWLGAAAPAMAGMTSLPQWLRCLARSDLGDATARSEINTLRAYSATPTKQFGLDGYGSVESAIIATDGKMYCAACNHTDQAALLCYDVASNTWSTIGVFNVALTGKTYKTAEAVEEHDGGIYVAIGEGSGLAAVWVWKDGALSLSKDFSAESLTSARCLKSFGGKLYFGGGTGSGLAETWTLTAGVWALDKDFGDFNAGYTRVHALEEYADELYAALGYTNGYAAVARLTGGSWTISNNFGAEYKCARCLEVWKGKLYAGLERTSTSTVAASIYSFDGSSWASAGDCTNAYSRIEQLKGVGDVLFAGTGSSTNMGSTWKSTDGATWALVHAYAAPITEVECLLGDGYGTLWEFTGYNKGNANLHEWQPSDGGAGTYLEWTDSLEANRDNIGTDGAGLSDIPWNADWDAEVQSECTDALNAYDPPTNTEMVAAFTEIKGSTWSGTTDTLEAIRDRGDSAWITATGFATPTNVSDLQTHGDATWKTATSVTVSDKTGFSLASTGLDAIPTTAPTGVASTFREMVVQLWRRFFKKSTLTSTQLKTYADDGSTVVTTQTVSDDGTTQSQGAGS